MSAPRPETEDLATLVQSPSEARVQIRSFVLTVTAGPDKGQSFSIEEDGRFLLGTGPASNFRLNDPGVSRRHAALERRGAVLRLTDLESTNGTLADRIKVIAVDLRGGEIVRVGGTTLRVDAREAVDAAVTATESSSFGRFVGRSSEVRRLHPLFQRLAQTSVPVIIEGETGTGKEVLAESIHDCGPRAKGPFVVFDCTAVPPNLVESELFGHERGAFTGAVQQRKGVFEQAQGGTLLIDEIGDLELSLQAKLLRAIERGEIRRVGGDRWLFVDARIVAATRRNLDHEVEAGRFRDDLFHRLAVARVELPPLRTRRTDIPLLVESFWRQFGGDAAGPPSDVLARWMDDPWPGNVRELRNAVARLISLGDVPVSAPASTRSSMPVAPVQDVGARVITEGLPFPRARDAVLEDFEQRFVAHLLDQHGGDVARAAAASGIGRRYFQKLRARTGR